MFKKLILLVLLIAIGWLVWQYWLKAEPEPEPVVVTNFEECVAAGNDVMESYPRQCRTSEGEMFVEYIGNELEKTDLIIIDNPRPNQTITSPLAIQGQARGTWFFEGDFPVKLLDEDGQEIAIAIAQAQGEWMVEDFVVFEALLEFTATSASQATLVLEKDNPSGLPENADQLVVPVVIGP